MHHQPSKIKALIQDWRWLLGVSALLALPTYVFTVPLHYAFIAHTVAVLFYVVILLLFGQGHVIEGALIVLIGVVMFAILSHPLQRARERQEQQQRLKVP